MAKAKKEEYRWSGHMRRVIPLANNTRARIADEKGKGHTFERGSEDFLAEVARLDEIMEGKITRDLESLGWIDNRSTDG